MGRKRVSLTDPVDTPAPGRDLRGAGRKMGISPHTVRVLVRRRELAHYRIGKRIVITDPDIDAYMARRRVAAREPRLAR
jgi:excisionase family DNA binding protein